MATIDLGKVALVWKGTYAAGTTYESKDVVQFTDSGEVSSYIYVNASGASGQTPSTGGTVNTTYWNKMAGGAAGIWASGLAMGSAGQIVKVNSGGNALEFGSSGTYSVHAFDQYANSAGMTDSQSGNPDYIDISGGKTVSFTPTSTDDIIYFSHLCSVQWGNYSQGCDVYLMMKAGSASIGSGDQKLNYSGQHAVYTNTLTDNYSVISKAFYMPCTGLTVGTTYYVEQAAGKHGANAVQFNVNSSAASSVIGSGADNLRSHYVSAIHYKKQT